MTETIDKKQYLAELQSQIDGLTADSERIASEIMRLGEEVVGLRDQRKTMVHDRAARMLPDLDLRTLARVKRDTDDFIRATDVHELIERSAEPYKKQREKVLKRFNPKTAEQKKAELGGVLAHAETDLDAVQQPYGNLLKDDEVQHLIDVGYDTKSYRARWWQIGTGYFSDWKLADELVEQYATKTWATLAQNHTAQVEMQALVAIARKNLEDHDAAAGGYADAQASIDEAPKQVLEQMRVKLAAWIDNQNPLPESMSNIASLTTRLTEAQVRLSELQTQKTGISGLLVKLRGLDSKARRSKKSTVPTTYMDSVRYARRPANPTVSMGGNTTMTVYRDTYVYAIDPVDAFLYGEMDGYFNEPVQTYGGGNGYGRSRGGSDMRAYGGFERDDSSRHEESRIYDDARRDTSGQS